MEPRYYVDDFIIDDQRIGPTYFSLLSGQTPTYQCNDETDNDNDGLTDYPQDPGCSSATDNDEREGLGGDVNGDGVVDVLDVQLCVNVILGTETDPDIVYRADVNGDGNVDVLDVQEIVNIILGV
jgi:hypothetical protein